jgi:glycosyltransferase Alg8
MTIAALNAKSRWRHPCDCEVGTEVRLRRGAGWRWQLVLLVVLVVVEIGAVEATGSFLNWFGARLRVLVLLAGIGCWRWGWFGLQSVRAVLYRYLVFPRLRAQAQEAMVRRGPVPEVTILAVTYKEKPWITQLVFEALFRELASVEGLKRPPLVVVATGCDEDDTNIQRLYRESLLEFRERRRPPPELVLIRSDRGKRTAIADALREIIAHRPDPEGAIVFTDGDSMMQPGLLAKVLPIFRLTPEVAAVTTNEDGWVKGPRWFAEWISLRFGLRHRTMCSVALSGKLLCLTGRMSVFRASDATDATFLQQIERDSIHHWLWDSFDMLSGDDKSTWFWLARHRRRMLYIPDAMVTTFEVVHGSAVQRALANIRRWSGNSLRHSWRAFQLGPRTLGWFCWYSLLDQRLAIWTVLVGPLFALLALGSGCAQLAAGYVLWVLLSRVAHASVSWWHGRRFSAFYIPLQILSDWAISLTKVWVLFHPAKQSWLNRGGRKLDTTKGTSGYGRRTAMAHYLCLCASVAIVVAIGLHTGLLTVGRELTLFLGASSAPAPAASVDPLGTRVLPLWPALGEGANEQRDSSNPTPSPTPLWPGIL